MQKIYIGIAGHIVCLDKSTGEEIWRTKIKSSSGGLTNLLKEDNQIIAYSSGHLFCLDAATGDILWQNPLKGLGYSSCIIAGSQQAGAAQSANAQAASAAIAATTVATTASS